MTTPEQWPKIKEIVGAALLCANNRSLNDHSFGGWKRLRKRRLRVNRAVKNNGHIQSATPAFSRVRKISPIRNRSVSKARRWLEAFRLSIN